MSSEESTELRKELENLKEIDPKGINKLGIVDSDIFMSKILQRYKIK